MRKWEWGHWYEKWALYVEREGGMAGPVLIVDQVPPDEAQWIVDALNEKEQRDNAPAAATSGDNLYYWDAPRGRFRKMPR